MLIVTKEKQHNGLVIMMFIWLLYTHTVHIYWTHFLYSVWKLFCIGMDYIKAHMEQESVPSPGSHSGSEEEDFFGLMKRNVQETTRQLDTYLASSATSMNVLKLVPNVLNLSLKINTPLPASAACERLFSPAGQIFFSKKGQTRLKKLRKPTLVETEQKVLVMQMTMKLTC